MINSLKSEHPEYQQLLSFARKKSQNDNDLLNHVVHCPSCQQDIEIIRDLEGALQDFDNRVKPDFGANHLGDDVINDYVYQRLSAEQRGQVDRHLATCGSCMKHILKLQALVTERRSLTIDSAEIIKLHRPWWKVPALGLAVAASATIATIIVLMPQTIPDKQSTEIAQVVGQAQRQAHSEGTNQFINHVALNGPGVQQVNHGQVNWYGGFIETEATGTVDISKTVNQVQAEIMAEKTARALAYAQIGEILGGVQITQKASYKDMLLQVDKLQIENTSFIRNARIIDKKLEWVENVPKVTVKMRVPLRGNYSVQSIVAPYINNNNDTLLQASRKQNQMNSYSGLVLDMRGVQHQPSMHVNLKISDSSTVSTSAQATANVLSNLKTTYYAHRESIQQDGPMGENPLILQVNSIAANGEIVVDPTDWNRALTVLSRQKQQDQLGVLF